MYRLIFLLAIVILGCGAALSPREMCLAECDDVGRQSERDTCRVGCPGSAREHVVSVEYAAYNGPPSWTCEAIVAFYVRLQSGLLTKEPEIIRAQGTGYPRTEAHSAAVRAKLALYGQYTQTNGLTFDDLVPETRAFLHRNQQRSASTHRCWYRGHDPHPDVKTWPAATWPRPKVQVAGLPGGVPAALAWDPRTSPPKIIDPSTSGKKWTCRGAVYFRVRMGSDLTGVYEIVDQLSQIDGPESHAESVLRDFLIARAKVKAAGLTGDMTAFVLDTAGGALEATPIKCWQNTKKGVPVDWRGPTTW